MLLQKYHLLAAVKLAAYLVLTVKDPEKPAHACLPGLLVVGIAWNDSHDPVTTP